MGKRKSKTYGYDRIWLHKSLDSDYFNDVLIDKMFSDQLSLDVKKRIGFSSLLDVIQVNDTVVITSLSCLGSKLHDLKENIESLLEKGVLIRFIKEDISIDQFKTLSFIFSLNILCDFIDAVEEERKLEGIEIAKMKGSYTGRKKTLSSKQATELVLRCNNNEKKSELAKEYNISRVTLYKYLRDSESS